MLVCHDCGDRNSEIDELQQRKLLQLSHYARFGSSAFAHPAGLVQQSKSRTVLDTFRVSTKALHSMGPNWARRKTPVSAPNSRSSANSHLVSHTQKTTLPRFVIPCPLFSSFFLVASA